MDKLTPEQRKKNMQAVKNKGSAIEKKLAKGLWGIGLRYRKNDKRYLGHPDVVLPKYRTIVFVHGCFWHFHQNCKYGRLPKSNVEFWKEKLMKNRMRDIREQEKLRNMDWNIIVVWECELKGSKRERTLNNLYLSIINKD